MKNCLRCNNFKLVVSDGGQPWLRSICTCGSPHIRDNEDCEQFYILETKKPEGKKDEVL